jgi:CBS domain-containing protein
VVDENRRLVGIIPLATIGRLAGQPREKTAGLVASQVATAAETVTPGDSLLDAIRRMGVRGAPSIPVVDRATGHLLGLVSRAHVLAVYEHAVAGGATGEHPVSFPTGRGPA